MVWNTDWTSQAACRGSDPDTLFVQGAAQNRAKAVCMGCGVRTECLADALDNRVEFGVWGGMTERERRALLRRRSNVTSWRRLLQTALEEYARVNGTCDIEEPVPVAQAEASAESRTGRAAATAAAAPVGRAFVPLPSQRRANAVAQ